MESIGDIMVKIIVDSTQDLTKEILEKNDIEVVPLTVNFSDGESYLDGVTIQTAELYEKVKEKKELPKTAAVTVGTLIDVFKKHIDNGDEIVYTGISAQMSRSYENALLAKEELGTDKIYVVDSKNLSTGIGLLILKAIKDRDSGLSAKEIAKNMEKNRELVLSQFAIEQMDYLYKGGRCSSVAKIFGSILKIKPIILVRDGKMHVGAKPLGKITKALDIMINQIVADKDRLDTDHILVTHSIAPSSRDYIMEKLKPLFPNVDIIETVAGSVIASHCGPGTIGILYMVKEK
ncbi:MAG: DegV family protein [Acholeplasmatales bacterium]|nr:DegV family protein [Acholeplasmatales bacterium]